MKACTRLLFFALAFALCVPGTASGQKWTAEQQALIDQLRTCWDAWDEAFANQDHAIWERTCSLIDPADPESGSFWWAVEGAPAFGLEASRRQFKGFLDAWDKISWSYVRPLDVILHGDAAVVYYYGMWQVMHQDGKPETAQDKRVEFFQKRNGQWVFLGGLASRPETQN